MPNNLKSERVRLGYTQKELAEVIGVHPISIKNWEKNIGSCKVDYLLALSNVFGVSPEYLCGITEDRRRHYETDK